MKIFKTLDLKTAFLAAIFTALIFATKNLNDHQAKNPEEPYCLENE